MLAPRMVTIDPPDPNLERLGVGGSALLPPRWKGCPPICALANLCSFPTVKALESFRESMWPITGAPPVTVYPCDACNGFHYWPKRA